VEQVDIVYPAEAVRHEDTVDQSVSENTLEPPPQMVAVLSSASTLSTAEPTAQELIGTTSASPTRCGDETVCEELTATDSDSPSRGPSRQCLEEKTSKLLQEDKALFEFDVQRREASLAALPRMREQVDDMLRGVPAEAIAEATHFCADETLVRYLSNCDCNLSAASSMLKATIDWRTTFFKGVDMSSLRTSTGSRPRKTLCPCCASDPTSHCFFRVGTDALGREVVYSCAGRALSKNTDEGVRHMALELERLFGGNSACGQVVWVIDFAGFGMADCNPRAGLTAVPLFASHYPERFAQIVLFGMPSLATGMCHVVMKLVDQVTRRRVLILRSEAARRRYMDAYWREDPAMLEWLQAALKCRGAPGCYPGMELSRALQDPSSVEMLERCAVLSKGR
jgi:hypothetical protein